MIQSNGLKHFECYDWLEGQYDVLDPSEVDIFESSLLTEWARTEVTVTQTFASMQTVVVHSDDTPVGAIVGGTIGGVALLGFAAAVAVFFFMRSRKKHKNGAARSGEPATPEIAQLPASVPSSPIATVPSGLSHGGPSVLSYYSQSQHDNGPNKASPLLYAQGPIDHQQQQQIHEAPGN
jgi:hypothetical protein